jgi:hypothetical protein
VDPGFEESPQWQPAAELVEGDDDPVRPEPAEGGVEILEGADDRPGSRLLRRVVLGDHADETPARGAPLHFAHQVGGERARSEQENALGRGRVPQANHGVSQEARPERDGRRHPGEVIHPIEQRRHGFQPE